MGSLHANKYTLESYQLYDVSLNQTIAEYHRYMCIDIDNTEKFKNKISVLTTSKYIDMIFGLFCSCPRGSRVKDRYTALPVCRLC